jgi:hypothetical protein
MLVRLTGTLVGFSIHGGDDMLSPNAMTLAEWDDVLV